MSRAAAQRQVPLWGRFEQRLESGLSCENPFQDVDLTAIFTGPSGRNQIVDGFWDGGKVWRIRFSPNEAGLWTFSTVCSDNGDTGLHDVTGSFLCVPSTGANRFERHGAVQVSENRRYFVHEDGTPFFWMGDTAWNGPLRSTNNDWEY